RRLFRLDAIVSPSQPLADRAPIRLVDPVQVKATLIDLSLNLVQLRLHRTHPRRPRVNARTKRITLNLQQRRLPKRVRLLDPRISKSPCRCRSRWANTRHPWPRIEAGVRVAATLLPTRNAHT